MQPAMSPLEKQIRAWGEPPAIPEDFTIDDHEPPSASLDPAEPSSPDPPRVPYGVRVRMSPGRFNTLNALFQSQLGRVTLQRIEVSDRPDCFEYYHEEWDDWLSMAHAWARQACFPPISLGEQPQLGLSTHIRVLPGVGPCIVFAVSDVPDDKDKFETAREWRYQRGRMSDAYPVAEKKSCPCIFIQIAAGAVDWDELAVVTNDGALIVERGGPLEHLLHQIALCCHARQCPRAFVSDGDMTFCLDLEFSPFEDRPLSSALVFGHLVPAETYPTMYLLLAALSAFSHPLSADPEPLTRGARDSAALGVEDTVHGFRAFDAFALARDRAYYAAFLEWKRRACARALACLPSSGSVLPVHRTEPVPRKLAAWRAFKAYKPVALANTIPLSICSRKRERNTVLEALLKYDPDREPLAFEVTDVLVQGAGDAGEGEWAQVYVGRLRVLNTSGLVVLKIFDERCFPVPPIGTFDQPDPHKWVLAGLQHADNMLRREQAAYRRLSRYQGWVVPHFYGCVEVELPGGYMALGIVMEHIAGVPLTRIYDSVCKDWTREEQIKLVNTVLLYLPLKLE